jgi:S1-C subfamily serine protease
VEIPSFKKIGAVRAKLVRRARTKGAIVVICAVVLVLGVLLAPPRLPDNPEPPKEKVAPMIEAEVEKREPARLFRGLREAGLRALPHVVSFHSTRSDLGRKRMLDFSTPNTGRRHSSGCGLVVAGEGAVLTHFAALGDESMPLYATHDGKLVPARVAAYEAETGLVLLQSAPIGASAQVQGGSIPLPDDLVIAVARRGALPYVVPVSLDPGCAMQCALMTYGGEVEPGMPVFDLSGSAIAVIGGGASDVVAYGVEEAMQRLTTLVAEEHPFPASLGLAFQAVSGALAERLGEGALVNDVMPDGPAARAGLNAGDVITSIGQKPVRSADEAPSLIASARPGVSLTLVFHREKRNQTVEVIPVSSPFGVSRFDASRVPPANAPKARAVFSADVLSAADVDGETAVLSIERTRVRNTSAARRLIARRRAPWLVYLQQGSERFFALLGDAR